MNDGPGEREGRALRGVVRHISMALASLTASVALGVLLAAPGCLNPRPEEDPSIQNVDNAPSESPSAGATVEPPRESCGDNPYLADCNSEADLEEASPEDPSPGAPGASPPSDVVAEPGDAGLDASDAQAP